MLAPNGTRFGGWNLNTADNDWLSGHAHAWGVFLHHPQWGGAVAQTEQVLATRGYAILDTNTASVGVELINRLARVVRPADRVFVYLAGHGAAGRSSTGDHTTASAFFHYIEFESGGLRLTDIAPAFSLMGDKGVDLAVFDGELRRRRDGARGIRRTLPRGRDHRSVRPGTPPTHRARATF